MLNPSPYTGPTLPVQRCQCPSLLTHSASLGAHTQLRQRSQVPTRSPSAILALGPTCTELYKPHKPDLQLPLLSSSSAAHFHVCWCGFVVMGPGFCGRQQ